MQKIADFARSKDIFGAPVLLNYRGKNNFGTVLGGVTTILLAVLLASYFAIYVKVTYDNMSYQASTPTQLFKDSNWDGEVTVKTKSSNMAIKFDVPITSSLDEIYQALRISYEYHYSNVEGDDDYTPIEAVPCT